MISERTTIQIHSCSTARFFRRSLVGFGLVLCFGVTGSVNGLQAQQPAASGRNEHVAKDFRYPDASATIEVETPYEAKSLAGRILDTSGAGVEKTLVECVSKGWTKRLDAVFTNSDGSFSFSRYSGTTQYLQISKPGFNTLRVKVKIKKNLNTTFSIELSPSG